jgi:hypothetical protein
MKETSQNPTASGGGAYIASPNSGAKLAAFDRARAPNLIRYSDKAMRLGE